MFVLGNAEIKYSSVVEKSTTTTISTSESYSYEACLGLYVDNFVSFTEQGIVSTIVEETLTAEGAGLWIFKTKSFSSTFKEIHLFPSILIPFPVHTSAFASIDVNITVAGQENVIIEG